MPSQPPFKLERIDHVLLLVHGMDRTLEFYEGVLGASVETRLPQYGMTELRAGTSHVDLVDVDDPKGRWADSGVPGGRNVDHVAFAIDGTGETALREHLAAHGVEIVEERRENNSLSFYFNDPSLNTIELILRGSSPA